VVRVREVLQLCALIGHLLELALHIGNLGLDRGGLPQHHLAKAAELLVALEELRTSDGAAPGVRGRSRSSQRVSVL
jgi:hypothetical protein